MTSSEEIPFNKPFLSIQRLEPCGNKYLMMIFVRLKGYKFISYDPELYTYERSGGVNLRYTIMHIDETDDEHVEEVFKKYEIVANRKEEDAIHVELVDTIEEKVQQTMDNKDYTALRTLSLMMMLEGGTDEPTHKKGGSTGSLEP